MAERAYKLEWLLGLEKETLANMVLQQSKVIEKLQQAVKAQAVPEWIPVYERLPNYLKPVWIIVDGKVNKYQWLCDAGDYGCWFEPHTIDFHEKECLDIDRVEMWAYCDLPPAAPEQPE